MVELAWRWEEIQRAFSTLDRIGLRTIYLPESDYERLADVLYRRLIEMPPSKSFTGPKRPQDENEFQLFGVNVMREITDY